MIEQVIDDLARLDQLERDHATDSITIGRFKQTIADQVAALSEADQAKLLALQQRDQEAGKLALEKRDHAITKKELRKNKFLKWGGWILAGTFATIAAVASLKSG